MDSHGHTIARFLAGAWRPSPPPDLSAAALASIAPLLLKSGAGALAWWRLRGSALADTPAGRGLREAYRLQALEAEVHALRIADVLGRLRGAGVEPLLVKGWAMARSYPESGLRHYSDVDLIVRTEESYAARTALRRAPIGYAVDLHEGPGHLDAASFDELAGRAQTVALGRTTVRILGPEDHLRVLTLHALRHGIFRPIWLVDLAVAVESRPSSFDWTRCFGPDRRRAEWVAGGIGLAHQLLGARLANTPVAGAAERLPGWLGRAVLRSWDYCEGVSHRPNVFQALLAGLGDARRLREELRLRWDRPIQATLEVRGPFNGLPRLPFQLAAAALRVPELLRTIPAAGRRRFASRSLRRGRRARSGRDPRRA